LAQADAVVRVETKRKGGRYIPQLFGPVFRKEFWVACRRKRTYVLQAVFVGTLALIVYLAWLAWTSGWPAEFVPVGELAEVGAGLFGVYVWAQFLLMCLVAPIEAAGLVAEERRRGTLELLFVTDLSKFDILVGAFLSRMLRLMLLVLLGLPVILCVLLFGGASPAQVIQAMLLTGAASFLAGATGFLFSAGNSRRAVPQVGAVITVFVLYSNLVYAFGSLLVYLVWNANWNPITFWGYWLTPPWALSTVASPTVILGFGGSAGFSGSDIWLNSVLASLAAAVILVLLTVLFVRRSTQPRAGVGARAASPAKKGRRRFLRRAVGRDVVFWREISSRLGGRFGPLNRIIYVALILGSYLYLFLRYGVDAYMSVGMGRQAEGATAFFWGFFVFEVLFLFLDALALSGRAIVSERSDPTFSLLLATPVSAFRIVLGKVKAIFRHLAVFIVMPILHVAMSVGLGIVSREALVTVPVSLLTALFIFVAACIFLSLYCRKLTGVVGWVFVIMFLLNGGITALGWLVLYPFLGGSVYGSEVTSAVVWGGLAINPFYWLGMSAMGAFAWSAAPGRRWAEYFVFGREVLFGEYLPMLLVACAVFVVIGFVLLWTVIRRLDARFGRCP